MYDLLFRQRDTVLTSTLASFATSFSVIILGKLLFVATFFCAASFVLTNLEYWTDSKGQKRPLPKISTMKEKDDKKQDNPGLSAYIYKTEKCPKCGQSMSLMRSRYGKCYLKCSSCGDMEYLTKDMVNEYIELKHITCPIHHCQLHAGLSKYGIFVRCVNGHFLKPDEI